jgi:hypothetical protein
MDRKVSTISTLRVMQQKLYVYIFLAIAAFMEKNNTNVAERKDWAHTTELSHGPPGAIRIEFNFTFNTKLNNVIMNNI